MYLVSIEKNKEKMILQFAVPSIIAMVLSSMISIVDGYFVGNYVGTNGLAAVNLGLPIVYLYLAVGLMIAVGGSSIAGRLLGAGEIEKTNQIFRQTTVLSVIVTVVLSMIMFVILKPISGLLNTDTLTREYFNLYYGIMLLELPIMVVISGLGMFIRGEGKPVFVMLTNVIAVILNIIFDYFFTVKLSLGVAGIAGASVLSVVILLIINILYIIKGTKVFHFGKFSFETCSVRETFFNGSSECIGELSMCISMAAYNMVILNTAGVDGVAAFTIIGYVSYVFSMIIVGFGQGIVPIISFSYGADKRKLAKQVRNITIRMVVIAAIIVFILMTFMTGWYSNLFTDIKTVKNMVIPGMRIQMSSFAFAGMNTIMSFYFTAIGKAKESAVISASRGLVILMIAIFTLPKVFGITGVWLVSLTTETVTLFISIYYSHSEMLAVE